MWCVAAKLHIFYYKKKVSRSVFKLIVLYFLSEWLLSIRLEKAVLSFNVSTNSGVFVVFVVASQGKHSSHIRSAGQINSPAYKLTKAKTLPKKSTHKFTNAPTPKPINPKHHQLKSSSTQELINPKAPQLKNSSTQKLKSLSFILQHCSSFRSVLAKI